MAFVDVSGFTAMSERLAPKGRLGAEEVTDVMSATFARLLGVAYENGGGLVKLGGDALLLFFDGDEHARARMLARPGACATRSTRSARSRPRSATSSCACTSASTAARSTSSSSGAATAS